ncbi:MAG TPA: hypothetical protein VGP91_08175, partial [Actinoplanes sp.]|nr:hypothetical protein [Actinoplanes sp.]
VVQASVSSTSDLSIFGDTARLAGVGVIETAGLTKVYPGVTALDGLDGNGQVGEGSHLPGVRLGQPVGLDDAHGHSVGTGVTVRIRQNP